MKKRRMSLVLVLVLCGAAVLFAQPMRMTTEERVANLKKELTLTDEQAAKVTAILKESEKKREAAFDKSGDDREARRAQMTALMEETDTKIAALLTKEQKKKYEELKKERRQRIEGRRERRE
ncbi:MAG: hypothetical protein HYV29_04395 [Ignavibacteriales bacterium]|nr:hypothetical protein [Ignavibacteriales bacterium]